MCRCAAEEEQGVLKGLRTQKRVIASCMGGEAAAQKQTYVDLWGSFVVLVGA